MKTVLCVVLLATLAVIVIVVGLGLLFSSGWRAEQTLLMNASPSAVHAVVADLRTWPDWADGPLLGRTTLAYPGPTQGVGALRSWSDARGVSGTTEIVRVDADRGVWFESRTGKEQALGRGSIAYRAVAAGTEVVWRESGDLPRPFGLYLRDGVERDTQSSLARALERLEHIVGERSAQPRRR